MNYRCVFKHHYYTKFAKILQLYLFYYGFPKESNKLNPLYNFVSGYAKSCIHNSSFFAFLGKKTKKKLPIKSIVYVVHEVVNFPLQLKRNKHIFDLTKIL